MSIIVRGMEMPKTCGECSFLQESVWKGKMYPCVCVAGGFVVKPSETDMKDGLCPLVALPEEHGDLIDRNALKKDYRMGNDCYNCETNWKSCQYDRVYSKMDFCEWLDCAPVVVETEGEE